MALTHFDQKGHAIMVDVSEKQETQRIAVAKGNIRVSKAVFDLIEKGEMDKGDVLGIARIAGIMATKKTSDLIPLCHPLMLTKGAIDFEMDREQGLIYTICTAKLVGKTGVEMEALTGVSVALLTIYDMCKGMDKGMVIGDIHLVSKSGGKSGAYGVE